MGTATVKANGRRANIQGRMPRKKRVAHMTPEDFRKLLEDAGLTIRDAAKVLGVGHGTVSRYQTGETPIAAPAAKLIRLLIKPKKK